ncbi:MAG: segregation/condensation protein A [Tepidisphaeraceae bacterium]
MEYRVELDVFNGPLDLLLYLIKRDELDVMDIPIARITESYVNYVELMRQMHREHGVDIDEIGDFLVMAATLMEIKSAMLLPTPPTVSEDGSPSAAEQLTDPRAELIKQLLEYKRFKDQASLLERQREQHEDRFPRQPVLREVPTDEPPPLDLDEVQIWDLLSAFGKIMGEIGQRKRVHEIVDDDTPIDLHAADIEDRLTRKGALTLRQLMKERKNRSEMIGVFLALLELIREKRIITRTSETSEEIALEIAPEEHRKTFKGASLHLSDVATEEAEAETVEPSLEDVDADTSSDDTPATLSAD